MRRGYSDDQVEFLRKGYLQMQIPELTSEFNARYNTSKSETAIKSALSNRGLTCGRRPGYRELPFFKYTREQAEYIVENYRAMTQKELTVAFNRAFGTDKTVAQIRAFTKNHKVKSGRTGRFESGRKSWNKGTKGLTGANSGSFSKGDIPANTKPVGHERICSKDGYVLIKTAEKNPYTGADGFYRFKHVVTWEQAHGPVPDGFMVFFKDGDKLNCDIENLEAISRAENLYLNRNKYAELPVELRPTMRVLAKVEVKRFEIIKGSEK